MKGTSKQAIGKIGWKEKTNSCYDSEPVCLVGKFPVENLWGEFYCFVYFRPFEMFLQITISGNYFILAP